jgi:hypothetical protein
MALPFFPPARPTTNISCHNLYLNILDEIQQLALGHPWLHGFMVSHVFVPRKITKNHEKTILGLFAKSRKITKITKNHEKNLALRMFCINFSRCLSPKTQFRALYGPFSCTFRPFMRRFGPLLRGFGPLSRGFGRFVSRL